MEQKLKINNLNEYIWLFNQYIINIVITSLAVGGIKLPSLFRIFCLLCKTFQNFLLVELAHSRLKLDVVLGLECQHSELEQWDVKSILELSMVVTLSDILPRHISMSAAARLTMYMLVVVLMCFLVNTTVTTIKFPVMPIWGMKV